MFRPVRTDAQARHCLLSVDYLPLWGPRGITSLSLTASGGANLGEGCRDFVRRQNRGVRKICRGKRRKSPNRFSLNRAAASYKSEEGVSLLIPLAHRASLLTALLAEVLTGRFIKLSPLVRQFQCTYFATEHNRQVCYFAEATILLPSSK
jgi:hypothetical protein